MLSYFKPLEDYLDDELLKNGEKPGWHDADLENYFI